MCRDEFSSEHRRIAVARTGVFCLILLAASTGFAFGQSSQPAIRQANGGSLNPEISADGRFVVFASSASNLVPGDTNGLLDIFVHDRKTGVTTRVNVSSNGEQTAGGESRFCSISGDGRFVTFNSLASNLVEGDTNGESDIFLHDRQTNRTIRLSVSSTGAQGNGVCYRSSISADGRYVAFFSNSSNLAPGETLISCFLHDIFVRDTQKEQTECVSISSSGERANGSSFSLAAVSSDGRFVAFNSEADNLVPNDANGARDVFVHDRRTKHTDRVSVSSAGQEANGSSGVGAVSSDGRYVAFTSWATNLVPGDTNASADIFVHDRKTGETSRVSVTSNGQEADGESWNPSISADGRFVAFQSFATLYEDPLACAGREVYVHDRQTRETLLVRRCIEGRPAGKDSNSASISADGRFIAFASSADTLVPGDCNGKRDVFVHDRQSGRTTLVSVPTVRLGAGD